MYNKLYNQVIRWNSKTPKLPILQELRVKNHKLQATDLGVWIETPAPIDLTDRMLDPTFLDGYDGTTASDPNDFPELELPKVIQEIELDGEAMANILWCAKFISKDQTRPVLTGVAMTSKGCVYGTDGYKMARRHYFNNITADHITLPPHLLTLLKLAKADKMGWTMTIYGNYEPEMVALKSGDLTIYSKLIDGNIPLYDPLIDNIKYTHKITIPKGMKIPKGYVLEIEMRNTVANHPAGHGQVYLQNTDGLRVLPTDIKIEPATLTDENPTNVDVVMKLSGTPFGVNPELLKAWKNNIELYFNNKTGTVMVKEV